MENEISNYFVLNRDSELWKDRTLFSDKGFASLTPDVSFRLKKKIDIPLKLSYLDNNSPKTKDVLTEPNSLLSFAIDKYNMLYILEKDTKKIRKLSIDRYEQYGSTDTDNMIFDEYIISCKGLGNPQSIAVTNRHIYILENSTLYVLSKIDYKLVKTINFRDKINLFKITEDEAIVFYSYSDEKTVLYKKNLVWDDKFSRGDGKEYQIINLSKSMKLDEDITDIDVNNREQEDDSKDNNNTHRHGNSESNDNNHVNNDRAFKNIIDLLINNKLKILYILAYRNLYVFNFDGKSSIGPINFMDKTRDEFNPTSLAIDEENNDIFIGNTTEADGLAFPRKLTFGNNMVTNKVYEAEKIGIQGQSWKLFFTEGIILGRPYPCLIIINIIPAKNKKENDRADNDQKDDGITRKEDSLREDRNWISIPYISCQILEEKPIYQILSPTTLTTESLDSLNEKTRWYRISIDQDIPSNTFVKLSYFCSNHEMSKKEWISGSANSNNILILDCVGRYLYLKVELSSLDKEKSPRFNKMTVYFSTPTYLRFLPEIYQEDEQSKIFLERFLCIFQTLLEETENKVHSFIKYLDVRATPKEFLPWLSSWLSLTFNEEWSTDSVRSFLERAPDIFRKRGTREGLEEILSIYLLNMGRNNLDKQSESQQSTVGNNKEDNSNLFGKDIGDRLEKASNYFFIVEGKSELAELSKKLNESFVKDLTENDSSGVLSYCFYVFLNPFIIDDARAEVIKRLIEKEKPAHTVAIVRRLQEWNSLGRGTYLDLDKIIRGRNKFVLGKSILSVDTIISSVAD